MQIHELIQGSDEWHQFRLEHFGASEAAAMLGLSKKVKRNELLHMKKTGTAKEFSDWVQANILDYGHEVEALARPITEKIIGSRLYPVTCSEGILSASCDGLTMSEARGWEHKQWNTSLAAAVAAKELPDEFMPQPQQCLMVTGAESWTFTVSDGTEENMVSMEVYPDQIWFERIRTGWTQFEKDLAEYVPIEVLPAAVAAPTMGLPALSIQVDGSISLISNLDIFGAKLTAFIENIDKNPSDDQSFANAEAAVKVLEKAQGALEAAESSALAQTASIDDMRKTVAMYSELARTTRLMMEKIVKARKETIRIEIQQGGKDKAAEHIAALNQRLGKPYMPAVPADFAGVMKGKKSITSLRDAVDTELARFKIEANAIADRIQINLTTLRELASEHTFLFADTAQIVLKATDDCASLVKLRISEHAAAEEKRLAAERARIAEEERVKAEARVKAEQEAIAKKADEEAAAKAKAESDQLVAPEKEIPTEANCALPMHVPTPAAKILNPAAAWPMPSRSPAPATVPTLRLGQINDRISPLSISADGLRSIGFEPAARDKPAMLYHESDFPRICAALVNHIQNVQERQAA
jgi:predicted phage-related endonuclease